MTGEERRNQILHILKTTDTPVAGGRLSKELNVSRQVIVQDIALLRANGYDIFSTNRGYLIHEETKKCISRVFKVQHTESQIEEELNLFVDFGGIVRDVFVYHKIYDVLKADMNIRSRRDVKRYMESIASGSSSPLMNVTNGYHYHTIEAEDAQTLDLIKEELQKRGFLAKLQDYEPVDFWGNRQANVDESSVD